MTGGKQSTVGLDLTIENPEKARQAANILALFLAVIVFVRGFHAHAGFALVMTVFLSTSARTLFEIIIEWNSDSTSDYPQAA